MSEFLWAPPSTRHIFKDAMIGQRCRKKCPPCLVIEQDRGLAWVAACGFRGPSKCGTVSVLYRLGAVGDLTAEAKRLRRIAIAQSLRRALEDAIPLDGGPDGYGIRTDVRAAEALGVVQWGVTYVGESIGAVGFDADGHALVLAGFTEPGQRHYETGLP